MKDNTLINVITFSEIRKLLLLNNESLNEFNIYLAAIFEDIAEKDINGNLGVSRIQLFNLLKIPLFISDKIFSAFNRGISTVSLKFPKYNLENDFVGYIHTFGETWHSLYVLPANTIICTSLKLLAYSA